jgi:hypothetical protein
MQDEDKLQAEMHAAEADLEHKIGELKAILEAKIETPKRVIHDAERTLSWVRAHAVVIAGALVGAVVLWHVLRAPHEARAR